MISHSHPPDTLLSRRAAIARAIALAGGLALRPPLSMAADTVEPAFTPENVLGPFYPLDKPQDRDGDLTRLRGRKEVAQGTVMDLSGRVLDLKGNPLRGIRLEIWQANTFGRYAHPMDESDLQLDPNFQGYAQLTTDREGRYRIRTIKPGAYPAEPGWVRPPHIHFEVRSRTNRLVTQMFFPDDPLNEKDALYKSLGKYAPAAVASTIPTPRDADSEALSFRWDIVLYER